MRTMSLSLIVSLLVLSSWNNVGAQEVEWPCWRGPNHDGKSTDTGLLKEWPSDGPKLLWKIKGIGKGFSTVSISKGRIYTTGDIDDRLVMSVLDMNGKSIGKVPVDKAWTKSHSGSRSTPTIDGDRVYLLSGHGNLVCFNAGNGERIWQRDLRQEFGGEYGGWGYAESVLIEKNLAIAKPGSKNFIMAFDKMTGEPIWSSKDFRAGPEYSSCVPFFYRGVSMIATGSKEGVVGVLAENGKVLWSNKWSARNTANCPDPVFSDGYVFWANGYGKGGICLKLQVTPNRVMARELWTTKDMNCHHGGYIVHEGHIYGNNGGSWACLELASGKRLWNERGVGKGSLCFADGMLYLFSERGGKAALATCFTKGLEIKGKVTVQGDGPSWAHPVVIGGRLYLRYDDNLYCFDVKAPSK